MKNRSVKTVAVIPSAGMGKRMGLRKKNYLPLLGSPVLAHTIAAFASSGAVDSIIVVVPPSDEEYCKKEIVERYGLGKVIKVVAGGAERQDSVGNGLDVAAGFDIIAVHDGARPLVTKDIIENTVSAAIDYGGAIAAVPVKDTIKDVSDGVVRRTVPRETLWSVQTPQAFRSGIITEAFQKAREGGFKGTDESSLVERIGLPVRVVMGSYENIKITTEEDLLIAECILKKRGQAKI